MHNSRPLVPEKLNVPFASPSIEYHSMRRTNHRTGFTLVELLVVVSIIALLLAILLPALGKSREVARRIVCASHMSDLSAATIAYANDFRGGVPIGHANDKFQFNYVIWRNDSNQGFWAMGLPYKARILTDPMLHYCPSTGYSSFDTDANPWYTRQPVGTLRVHTRSTYGARPVVNWETIDGTIQPDGPFPTIQALGHAAIYADLFTSRGSVDNRHVDGVNVGRLDGSAVWVGRSRFDDALGEVVVGTFSVVNNDPQWRIWEALDR